MFSAKSANCTLLTVWCTPNTVFYKPTGEINKHKQGYGGDKEQKNITTPISILKVTNSRYEYV